MAISTTRLLAAALTTTLIQSGSFYACLRLFARSVDRPAALVYGIPVLIFVATVALALKVNVRGFRSVLTYSVIVAVGDTTAYVALASKRFPGLLKDLEPYSMDHLATSAAICAALVAVHVVGVLSVGLIARTARR